MSTVSDLEPYERLLAVVGPRPVGLAGPAVRLVVFSGLFGYFWAWTGLWPESSEIVTGLVRLVAVLVLVAVGVRWVVRPWWRWSGQWCALTSHRLLIGYRRQRADWSIPYGMITNVDSRSGLAQWITGTRELSVNTTMREYPAVFRWLDRRSQVPEQLEIARQQFINSPAGASAGSDRYRVGLG